MELSKEVLDALALAEGETVLKHWRCHNSICVLTNRRLVMLSPHHILSHPHHEAVWSVYLQEIRLLEVMKMGDATARVSQARGSWVRMGAGGFAPRSYDRSAGDWSIEETGTAITISGDYCLHVDNVVVFTGGPDDASSIRDDIERAASDYRKALGVSR
jgi:hypothetical protein